MNPMKFSVAIALTAFLTHARATLAQSTATVAPTSTQGGVYTPEQADRGKNVYFGKCRSCHNPSTGDAFARVWVGKTVEDLFSYVLKTMPSNDPGTLDPYDDADVVAYLLQVTGMPPGQRELPVNTDSLKPIRIDMKDVKKDPPRRRKDGARRSVASASRSRAVDRWKRRVLDHAQRRRPIRPSLLLTV